MNRIIFAAALCETDPVRMWRLFRLCLAAAWTAVVHEIWGTGPELAPAHLYLQLMLVDFVTGLSAAWAGHRTITSRIAHTGVLRKLVGGLGALAMAHAIDDHMGLGGAAVRDLGMLLVGVESISIVENLSLLGIKIPTGWFGKLVGPPD
ncbi:MAG TPA: phage holin family protein [Armatimonadota bacterium]